MQSSRLRSAREWVFRFAPCPRGVTSADADPFVRAVARTSTWTVRPSCRRLRPPAFEGLFHLLDVWARHRGGPPHPAPHYEDAHDAPLIGPGRNLYIPMRTKRQQSFRQTRKIVFPLAVMAITISRPPRA